MGASKRSRKREAKASRNLVRRKARHAPYAKILIVCEGEKTEPNYFMGLRDDLKLSNANVQVTGKSGSSPISVVDYAKKLYIEEKELYSDGDGDSEESGYSFDKVYCVFDKDQHTTYCDALEVIRTMEKPSGVFRAVTSVPCFEYFLLLHFRDTTMPFAKCAQAEAELKKYLRGYQKGKVAFSDFRDNLDKAKERATRALKAAKGNDTHNPSTRAHELVQYMQNLKKKRKTP
ncbi:MAG: CRISPR-associated protein [Arenicellales bacterium IbO2]|nr:RloB family protein [Gammaproteobacteria bacterium]MDA7961565.1 RloB family protein [Gammaproteobacteria bacterium]MDA7995287.1 RloB family protein [Gammaproteobacteria bacterium]MDA8024636.1 RloB family protein [Gammaproteobacteria bacterium]CAJ2376696.1 MAG: CRISPR-associated protein [Arenicellales bacterium IbO2]